MSTLLLMNHLITLGCVRNVEGSTKMTIAVLGSLGWDVIPVTNGSTLCWADKNTLGLVHELAIIIMRHTIIS
jgi:hypothetical protein